MWSNSATLKISGTAATTCPPNREHHAYHARLSRVSRTPTCGKPWSKGVPMRVTLHWCFQSLALSSVWSTGISHATCNDMHRVVFVLAHQVEEQWDQDRNKKKSFHLSHHVQEAVIIGR